MPPPLLKNLALSPNVTQSCKIVGSISSTQLDHEITRLVSTTSRGRDPAGAGKTIFNHFASRPKWWDLLLPSKLDLTTSAMKFGGFKVVLALSHCPKADVTRLLTAALRSTWTSSLWGICKEHLVLIALVSSFICQQQASMIWAGCSCSARRMELLNDCRFVGHNQWTMRSQTATGQITKQHLIVPGALLMSFIPLPVACMER